jgi:hypothetical protein
VGVVCGLLMVSGVVVLGRFTVMVRSVRMMFRCLLVMFRSFLGHCLSSMARSSPNISPYCRDCERFMTAGQRFVCFSASCIARDYLEMRLPDSWP